MLINFGLLFRQNKTFLDVNMKSECYSRIFLRALYHFSRLHVFLVSVIAVYEREGPRHDCWYTTDSVIFREEVNKNAEHKQ